MLHRLAVTGVDFLSSTIKKIHDAWANARKRLFVFFSSSAKRRKAIKPEGLFVNRDGKVETIEEWAKRNELDLADMNETIFPIARQMFP